MLAPSKHPLLLSILDAIVENFNEDLENIEKIQAII